VTVVPERFDATGAIYIKAYQSRRSIIVPRECIREYAEIHDGSRLKAGRNQHG